MFLTSIGGRISPHRTDGSAPLPGPDLRDHGLDRIGAAHLHHAVWRKGISDDGVDGATIRTTLPPATRWVFWFAKANFLFILLIGAFWLGRNKVYAGLWLALGFVIKPIFIVLGGVLLVRRRWRTLALAFLVLVFLAGVALLVVGPASYCEYFTRNPSLRAPVSIYLEPINQSLLSTILRLEGRVPEVRRVLLDPLFLGLAFSFTLVTFAISAFVPTRESELSIGLFTALGLLIYPGTLAHYSVLLIPAVLYLCSNGTVLGLRAGNCCVILTVIFGLTGVSSGTVAILGHLLAWLVFVFLAWRQIKIPQAIVQRR